jgi:hypothetical protein
LSHNLLNSKIKLFKTIKIKENGKR